MKFLFASDSFKGTLSTGIDTAPENMPLTEAMQRAEELYLEAAVWMFSELRSAKII